MNIAQVYLIPTYLHETNLEVLPTFIINYIEKCQVFFVENERTARRFIKQLKKDFIIDDHEWFAIQKTEATIVDQFKQKLKEGKTIGIISEAGCPGIADPGQLLVAAAQAMNITVTPLVGPSAILLALMASGLNGQHFSFLGYLPIDSQQRVKTIKEIESESAKKNSTQIFIETPYRNNQLLEALLQHCHPDTQLCIGCNITAADELIKTKTISQWKKQAVDLHKKVAIFLLKG